MSVDLRTPNITGRTEAEKLSQIQSYLYQLVGQLEWAFNNISQEGTAEAVPAASALEEYSAKTGAAATFNSVKSLIIKSADIVNAYYETINERLEGVYVAQSEFGTYSEQTAQTIKKNSTDITQMFSNIQTIASDLEEIESEFLAVNAYIKSGLLEYDESGIPIYGLEIGQRNSIDGTEVFNKYARFSSDRLSFYDQNDIEVAYISDYKLHITDAEVVGNLTLGKYEIDTSDGIAFRWVGGA